MANSTKREKFGIKIYFAGQIGNQMFHYCLGKILAERTGLAFDVPKYFVDWKGDPVKWTGNPLFKMEPAKGKRFYQKETFHCGGYHWYDFDTLPKNKPIHICYGHWCDYKLYQPHKGKIKRWLKIPDHRFVKTDPEAVYIHVRRTDFVKNVDDKPIDSEFQSQATSIDGFARALEAAKPFSRIVIVTDEKDDPFLRKLFDFGYPVEIVSSSWDNDFLTLASCKKLIMSCSTFSWWAGFLGKAEKIICPIDRDSYWHKGMIFTNNHQYPNLHVFDEPERWLFI